MARQTILGAGGTIGRSLASELRRYTGQVRLVSRNPQKVHETDELVAADLTDRAQVIKAVEGSSVVYLLVGFDYKLSVWRQNWPPLMSACIDGCLATSAALVFFDNVYLYDESEIKHMTEDSKMNPPSRKGEVRAAIIKLLWNAVQKRGLKALVARSADFYGPGNEKSFLIETVYKNQKRGKKANWFADAHKKHSFTFTPDAAKATALLGNTDDAYGQTWNLPTDPKSLTGEEWVRLFAGELGARPDYTVLGSFILKVLGVFIPFLREMPEMLYQYDRDYFFDSSKFMKRFPEFRVTTYKEGIRLIVEADGKPNGKSA